MKKTDSGLSVGKCRSRRNDMPEKELRKILRSIVSDKNISLSVDSGRKECPLRYGGAGFRFGRRETPEIFGCDYLAVEMDDGDISFPFISMR